MTFQLSPPLQLRSSMVKTNLQAILKRYQNLQVYSTVHSYSFPSRFITPISIDANTVLVPTRVSILGWTDPVIIFTPHTQRERSKVIDRGVHKLLPARASEQGNVIGSVRIYINVCTKKKIVIEWTRDLSYLKFVATDFSPKTISPSAGENSGDLA